MADVVTLPSLNPNFPLPPEPEIIRDNYLELVRGLLTGTHPTVIVEGDEGVGKTTLLSQYARRYPQTAVSCFIVSGNRWAYDPELLRLDLAHQLHWLVNKEELTADGSVSDSRLAEYYRSLSSLWRFRDTRVTFVIDGLHNIPSEEHGTLRLLLELLPFGRREFSFLLSGSTEVLEEVFGLSGKPCPLAPFTPDETKRFLSDRKVSGEEALSLHRAFGGMPGHLATVKRALESDLTVEQILSEPEAEIALLYDSEWEQVEQASKEIRLALAAVAFLPPAWTTEELAELLSVEAEALSTQMTELTFVEADETSNTLRFVSESFRQYAQNRLDGMEKKVRRKVIERLMTEGDSRKSFKYLPELYLQAGKYEDLVGYLEPETLTEMVPLVSSAGSLREKTQLGLQGARELGRDGDLFRFGLEGSIIGEFAGIDVWESEIEARMALGMDASARALTDRVQLKEDRLHLLAIIARTAKQRGVEPDPTVVDEIERLYGEIDASTLSNRSTEIAAELIHSCPELALDLVEKAASLEEADNTLDAALAALSLSALDKTEEGETRDSSLTEEIRSRIKNPGLRNMTSGASLLFGDSTAGEVIGTVEGFDDSAEALFLIRQWLLLNAGRLDAGEVIRYGLKRAIESDKYSPSARVFRELAHALPSVEDESLAASLVAKFDGQREGIRKIGPTLEFVRCQCLIARCQSRYDLDGAVYRLLDVYEKLATFSDQSRKLAALGQLVATLDEVDLGGEYAGGNLGLRDELTEQFNSARKQLLEGSAHHYEALKSAIEVVAQADLSLAIEMTEALNTRGRRDRCRLAVCRAALKQEERRVDVQRLVGLVQSIEEHDVQDQALVTILKRVCFGRGFGDLQVEALGQLIDRTQDIWDAERRTRANSYWLGSLARHDNWGDQLNEHIVTCLQDSWNAIDVTWSRVDLGFEVAALLAEHNTEIAEEFFDDASELRGSTDLNASAYGSAYLSLVDLVGRAFRGLLEGAVTTDADFRRVERLVDRVPGRGLRAAIWGDVALRARNGGNSDLCQSIVGNHIRPLLEDIESEDRGLYYRTLVDTGAALYASHQMSALQEIGELPEELRDIALLRISDSIARGCLPGEPYTSRASDPPDLDPDEMVEFLDLASRMSMDSRAAILIWKVAWAARATDKLTRRRRGDIAQRIREVAGEKFPDAANIQHEGYLITAEAAAVAIERGGTSKWQRLRSRAGNIPNLSDRVFVLGFLTSLMPSGRRERVEMFREARDLVSNIPSLYDRVSRLLDLAGWAVKFNEGEARDCIREAMRASTGVDQDEVENVHTRAMDLAHHIDPDFAAGLTDLVEPDRAETGQRFDVQTGKIKANLEKQLRIREVRQDVVDEDRALTGAQRRDLAGSGKETLASLNAGRFVLLDKDRIHAMVVDLAQYDFREAYQWYACLIEMLVRKYGHTDQVSQILRPIFEHVCWSTEFCRALVSRSNETAAALPEVSDSPVSAIVIHEGEREQFLRIAREWLRRVVDEKLVICDPYFGPESLEALQMIMSEVPGCTPLILTSRRHHDQEVEPPWDSAYQSAWRNMSDVEGPPESEIVIVGSRRTGKAPIHDRWWLSPNGGLKLGTSFRSVGRSGECDVTEISAAEASQKLREVQPYIDATRRMYSGERLSYTKLLLP